MNRRTFTWTAAAFAATLSPSESFAATALPSSTNTKARLAISSYPFRGYIESPQNNRRNLALKGMNIQGFAAFVREEFNVQAIEVVSKHFESLDPAYLSAVRADLAKQNVRLINIPMDNKSQLCSLDKETRDAAFRLHCQWMDAAVALSCPSVRIRMPVGDNPSTLDIVCASEAVRKLAAYAQTRGVVLSIENDSPYTETPAQIIAVLKAAGSRNAYALPDFANGLASGDEAANAGDMRRLFRYAYNICHAKDWEHIRGVRQNISLQPIVDISRKAGFKGWYSLESDSLDDPMADTHRLRDAMLTCLHSSVSS